MIRRTRRSRVIYLIVGCLVKIGSIEISTLNGQATSAIDNNVLWQRENLLYRFADSTKTLVEQGETTKAVNVCNTALNQIPPGIISKYQGYLVAYKCSAYLRTGNYYLSQKCYKLALSYGRVYKEKALIGTAINNLGVLAMESRDFIKADRIFTSCLDKTSPIYNEELKAPTLMNLGALSIRRNDTLNGKVWFASLLILFNQKDNYLFDRNFGIFELMMNESSRAAQYLNLALSKSLKTNGPGHYQTALSYFHLGELYHNLGLRDSAEMCYSKASDILYPAAQTNLLSKEIYPTQYETVFIEFELQRAKFYAERESTVAKGFQIFSEAINRILFLSHAITAESTRFIIAEKGRTVFNQGIACALKLYDQTGDRKYLKVAFEWSLQSKSLSLNWLVEKDLVYARVGIPVELTNKLQIYRKTLDELLGDSLDFTVQVPLDSIGRVIRFYEETENLIRDKYDEIRKEIDTDPVSSRISGQTFANEQYLGYYDLDSLIVVFSTSTEGIQVKQIRKDSLLIKRINRYKEILITPPHGLYGKQEVREFADQSLFLYKALIEPVIAASDKTRLAIHPDGILQGFPFEALTTIKSNSATFKGLPYLINRFQIRYLTTPMLNISASRRGFRTDSITIITCRDASGIPEVAQEVAAIAKHYRNPSIQYLEQVQLRPLTFPTRAIIHISSHLSINKTDALKTGVYCQSSTEKGISFKDILAFSLSESQVFINACESGAGPVNHGEGLMSFGLAFSMAGCSTIVQQLWKAPDHSSSVMAQSYYSFLGRLTPADALTRSKIEYLSAARSGADHPFYWAGMVCYSSSPGKTESRGWIIAILIMVSLGGILYGVFRNRSLR